MRQRKEHYNFLMVAFFTLVIVAVDAATDVVRAVNSQGALQLLLLLPQLHGVHQVVDVDQRPHGGGEPGLDVAVLPHHQHAEVLPSDLQVAPQPVNHVGC
ncbi:hypothetical protein JZ751_016037 [Albula glossodonta]|uniref:Secreted protein n=1 Tax=Albula glossodonta TaxID=121402 RepID=A0A8T2NYV9_9TELE|nr:hypothetical protein JZ751_016037 [Albula glossodonta]